MNSPTAPASDTQEKPKTAMDKLLKSVLGQNADELVEGLRQELAKHIHTEVGNAVNAHMAAIRDADIALYRNVPLGMQRIALLDSAKFAVENMLNAANFNHPHTTLQHALSIAPKGGMALEFGVFSGTTLKIIADARNHHATFGFDSFEGLPEGWRSGFPAGAFAVDQLPQVPGAELVVGWFNETLPGFLEKHEGPVDFLHVDCDLYSSSKTVFDLVGPRLRAGSIVMFDEFFNYPGWQQHEYKAWAEFAEEKGVSFQYEAYTMNNEQVALKILSI